ncbi:MAG TPA: ornithine cyclodeaminase family protein [Stellaceae bacterium]|nr:ornithine cyclodeaminase family protein [Stellaceae bacterium]
MTLILTNEEITRLLTMKELIPALEDSYIELIEGRGANGPRSDIVTPTTQRPDGLYALKQMSAVVPKLGIGAVRINSDILYFPESGGTKRREKMAAVPGGRYVGLVLLFSTHDGAPLAICPDGVMQRMRVGATNAIAAKYLARKDARRVAIIGSGGQAEAQLLGLDALFALEDIRVFSPSREHRDGFARTMGEAIGKTVRPCDSAAAACKGADIVACATNALAPVFMASWVEPGMLVSSIRPGATEIERPAWDKFDLMAVFNRADDAVTLSTHGRKRADAGGERLAMTLPTLFEIVTGRHRGRARESETICFINNLGMGYQFAATGHVVYERARALGLGRELPTEWFTETVQP